MEHEDLRKKILNLEPYPEDLKMKLREEIAHVQHRPLKSWERIAGGCAVIALIGAIPYKLSKFATTDILDTLPVWSLALYAAFIGIGCWGLVYTVRALREGSELRREGNILLVAIAVLVVGMAASEVYSNGTVSGRTTLVAVSVCIALLYQRMEAVERRLRERVLRNELALIELTERVGNNIESRD